ncbi:MAG: xanthine dehydrogenase accessory protein XdhC [Pseudomonadota bacterium]|jgi:xanthine dehydrogenase accessory protein XdhC
MPVWRTLRDFVQDHGGAALVTLAEVRGSAPREVGARMVVRPDGAFHGTIGGGRLEWEALAEARRAMAAGRRALTRLDLALGPDLGQCCGGRVTVHVEVFGPEDADELVVLAAAEQEGRFSVVAMPDRTGRVLRRIGGQAPAGAWREHYGEAATPVLLFGAGHVGRALVLALAPLPFAVRWLDARPDAFPPHIPANATAAVFADPQKELAAAPAGAFVLVMTHDHALDLAVVSAALRRPDIPYIGLIGSETKRARFVGQLARAGLEETDIARLVCPIGIAGITGKSPAIIAAATAADLLLRSEVLR